MLIYILFIALGANAQAAEKKFDAEEILCERTPTAHIVGESIPSKTSSNPCSATAKIQAIGYDCGNPMDTYTNVQKYLRENIRKAKARCKEFCKSVDQRCTGYFNEPSQCGFTVPTNRALETGKNVVHCPSHCKGQAFNYCSIYHANFFAVDPSLFTSFPMNCFCQKKN